MFFHEIQLRVRYGETDKMGYLYYGNYALYYEVGRVEALRSLGLSYREMEDVHGISLPVVHVEQRFVRPAYYDDLLTVRTEIRSLPTDHIVFHVEVYNEKRKLVNAGRVRLCFFDAHSKKVVPAPHFLMEKLLPFFQTESHPPSVS